jgi:hypothetical protein
MTRDPAGGLLAPLSVPFVPIVPGGRLQRRVAVGLSGVA